jgi:predicted molibdopterin-dependent oxidoreductase YjgC
MNTINLIIDGIEIEAHAGETLLTAAAKAEIYIPTLCAHPDLSPGRGIEDSPAIYRGQERIESPGPGNDRYEGCQLCLVKIEGSPGLALSCDTLVAEGMVVHTNSPEVQEQRRHHLSHILATHPHACLTCAQREGCSIVDCSTGVPPGERCCPKLNNCELQAVADYIGIAKDTPRYVFRDLEVIREEALFDRDYNLCVGCGRCIRACCDWQEIKALGSVVQDGNLIFGTSGGPSLRDSKCKWCGACVLTCPTGALMEKRDPKAAEWLDRCRQKRSVTPVRLPPESWLALTQQCLAAVPETEGVYQLLDGDRNIICIAGTATLRQALEGRGSSNAKARFFAYEESPMYTQRESQLIQQYLRKYGHLPEANDELDDLF